MTYKNPTQRPPRSRLIDLDEARRAREVARGLKRIKPFSHLPTQKQIEVAMLLNRFYRMLERGPRP